MKTLSSLLILILSAGVLAGSDTDLKQEVTEAAQKLADASNYTWKTIMESGGGSSRSGGPVDGKAEKGGLTHLSFTRGENTIEAAMKGSKSVVKIQDAWHSLDALPEGDAGGQRNPARMIGRLIQSFKPPTTLAQDVVAKTRDLKKVDGAIVGTLTEEGVKEIISLGGRRGGEAPSVSNGRGSAKFWVKDGVLSKCEVKVQGTVSFNGNDREVDRTTIMEVKDVGSTKLDLPEDVRKKL